MEADGDVLLLLLHPAYPDTVALFRKAAGNQLAVLVVDSNSCSVDSPLENGPSTVVASNYESRRCSPIAGSSGSEHSDFERANSVLSLAGDTKTELELMDPVVEFLPHLNPD